MPPEDLAELPVGGAGVIAQMLPELRARWPDLPEPPPLDPAQARFRLFDAVTTFLLFVASDGGLGAKGTGETATPSQHPTPNTQHPRAVPCCSYSTTFTGLIRRRSCCSNS